MVENQVVSEVYTKLELGKSCVVRVYVHVSSEIIIMYTIVV